MLVAIAVRNGQIEFRGEDSRASGRASPTVVTTSSRRSSRRPVATGRRSQLVPKRVRARHDRDTGRSCRRAAARTWPIPALAASQGLSPAGWPTRALRIAFEKNSQKAERHDAGAQADEQVCRRPSPSRADRCRCGAACPRARADASGRRSELKPTKTSPTTQRPSRSLIIRPVNLGKPVVDRTHQRKHRAADQHVMEMGHDEIGVVHLRVEAAPTPPSRPSGRRSRR